MRGGRTGERMKRRCSTLDMPPLRGELLRSMMMGQQGGSLRYAPSMGAAGPREKYVYAKRRSNKCPRVTTQSTLPGLLSYTNYVHYNTSIDSSTLTLFDLHVPKVRCVVIHNVLTRNV